MSNEVPLIPDVYIMELMNVETMADFYLVIDTLHLCECEFLISRNQSHLIKPYKILTFFALEELGLLTDVGLLPGITFLFILAVGG